MLPRYTVAWQSLSSFWSTSGINQSLEFLETWPEDQPGSASFFTYPQRNRKLMKKRWSVDWPLAHKAGFESSNMAVSYFDPAKHGETILDASPVCLATLLLSWHKVTRVHQHGSVARWTEIYIQTERFCQGSGNILIFQGNLLAGTFAASADYKSLGLEFNNPSFCPPS